jgi:hypothetical protein
MTRQHATSLALGLLLCLCPSLLVQCGGATEPGTETGNPPVLDERRLYLVEGTGGLSLVAEPGAISPGGASLEIVNRRTGESVQAAAQNDGSLSVSIPGLIGDEYDVTLTGGGRSVSARVSSPRNGTDTLSALSCQTLENVLGQRVATGFDSGDRACTRDSECVSVGWGTGCYYQCGETLLSSLSESATRASVEADTAPICAELESRCERQAPSSCPPDAPGPSECRDGTCQPLNVSGLSCNELSNDASAKLRKLLAESDRTCSVDADCTLRNDSVSCFADCGNSSSVATAALAAVEQGVNGVERNLCGPFSARACPAPIALPCTPPPRAASPWCNAGSCEIVYTD